jgi:hypothetical protein
MFTNYPSFKICKLYSEDCPCYAGSPQAHYKFTVNHGPSAIPYNEEITYPATTAGLANCPGVKCNFVDINMLVTSRFRYGAKATLNDDVTTVLTPVIFGGVSCGANSPSFTSPALASAIRMRTETTPYEF